MKTTKILSLIAFLLCFSAIATAIEYSIPNNEIHYTSIDGNIVTPYKTDGFGANVVSNIYENGQEFFIKDTNSPSPITNCQKILREDQILILRNGQTYTMMGQPVNL